jgi:uncharacterized protein YmfQ (DUF2313 family)
VHFDALKKISPVAFGGDFDAGLVAEGAMLDAIMAKIDAAEMDSWPDQTTQPEDFERVFALKSSGTIADRRNAIVASIRAYGGLSVKYFVGIIKSLGYDVTIREGSIKGPWRVGISKVGDKVYPSYGDVDSFVVVFTGVAGPLANIEAIISDLKPATVEALFEYNI